MKGLFQIIKLNCIQILTGYKLKNIYKNKYLLY